MKHIILKFICSGKHRHAIRAKLISNYIDVIELECHGCIHAKMLPKHGMIACGNPEVKSFAHPLRHACHRWSESKTPYGKMEEYDTMEPMFIIDKKFKDKVKKVFAKGYVFYMGNCKNCKRIKQRRGKLICNNGGNDPINDPSGWCLSWSHKKEPK